MGGGVIAMKDDCKKNRTSSLNAKIGTKRNNSINFVQEYVYFWLFWSKNTLLIVSIL